jgi:hypothetical protein
MYGDYAVNPSTGIPDISIPLYEMNHHGFKLPLVLKYTPKPIKPGYNYDVFGFGWALSTNGCVSRTIEYVPDEWRNFQLQAPGSPQTPNLFNQCTGCLGDYNYAHDKFNAVLPNGTSFDFIIDNQYGNIIYQVSNGRQVKISCSISTQNIVSFIIVDEDGVKYTFDGADVPAEGAYQMQYVSWMLTRIDLPNSTEPVILSYNREINPQRTSCGEYALMIADYYKAHYVGGAVDFSHTYSAARPTEYITNAYKMRLLTAISFGKNLVTLSYKNATAVGSCQIDKIQIQEDQSLIREIGFTTTIQGNASTPCYTYPLAGLDALTIKGPDNTASFLKYECFNSPPGVFNNMDHWGYLTSSSGMALPNFNIYVGFDIFDTQSAGLTSMAKDPNDPSPFYKYRLSPNDTRSPVGPHCLLYRLKYPAGGFTEFEFENHKFLSSTDLSGNFIYDPASRSQKYAAGFRIKTITNYSSDGVEVGKKNYRYGKTLSEVNGQLNPNNFSHTGLGEAAVDPNLLTYLSHANFQEFNFPMISTRNMVLGLNANGQRQSFSDPFITPQFQTSEWGWTFTVSAHNFRKLLNGRPPVVYPEVTVYDGNIDEDNNIFPKGKTVYKYALKGDYPGEDFFEPNKDYGNVISYEAKPYYYDRLIEKADYAFDVSRQQFKLLRKDTNTYQTVSDSYLDYQFGNKYLPECYSAQPLGDFTADHNWPVSGTFSIKSSYFGTSLLSSKTTTTYDQTGNSISTIEGYYYNGRSQLTGKMLQTSDGKNIETGFKYPETGISGTPPVIEEMVLKNIISPVIETSTKITYPTNTTLAGRKIDYAKFGTNQIIMPAKEYELEITPSSSNYVLRTEVTDYTANGNPLGSVAKDGIRSAYLWGYNDRYMTAEVKNAYASDIAYSSFEDDAKGNWNYSGTATTPAPGAFVPTGRRYYELTASTGIDKTVSSGNTYIVSYWRNAGSPYTVTGGSGVVTTGPTVNGWTYFEHKITATGASVSISGTGAIDELRLYPANALMTTYTYDPLIGITSLTDANSRISYYVYDVLGRLQMIKDKDGNIIKTFEYKYRQ